MLKNDKQDPLQDPLLPIGVFGATVLLIALIYIVAF